MSTILSPAEIKQLCQEYSLHPSKQYGQHYLISDAPIRKMIEAAELSKDDTVVEIGPGFGVLTLAIAPLVKKVIAFEIEQKLRPYWEEKQKEFPNVEIIWGNALNQLPSIIYHLSSYKVLANLPYQITSDALRVILEADPLPERVIVMVQKEVAERMTAKPTDMSVLSVAVQYHGKPSLVAKVPAGSFWPVPKVESAVVAIRLSNKRYMIDDKRFFTVVRAGFSHKRKQLWRNVSAGLHLPPERVKQVVREVVGNEKARAEELTVEQWRELVKRI